METGLAGWMGSLTNGSDESGGQNSNLTNNAWVTWDMMSLKLGKRHYSSEESIIPDSHVTTVSSSTAKRGTPPYPCHVTHATTTTQWPTVSVTSSRRCQVEGCNVALGKAKEYYKRHKVCEIHSKAPKVVVLGLLKRFCQQCSRFHDITEFDEAKRSCRRRLEGHNLRRRKGGALSDSLPPNLPRPHENNSMMKQRLRPLPPSPSPPSKPAHALSLLSSPKTEYSISTGDLSYRCSAALYELIAANRSSTSVARNFWNQNNPHQKIGDVNKHTSHDTQMLDQSSHTTSSLDMKQATALDFGLLSMKEKSRDPEEWTDYCWSAFGGSNVV